MNSRLLAAVALASCFPILAQQSPAPPRPPGLLREATGLSGALRVAIAQPGERLEGVVDLAGVPADPLRYRWVPAYGTPSPPTAEARVADGLWAPGAAGVWRLELASAAGPVPLDVTLVTTVPATELVRGYLHGYHVGSYPKAWERLGPRYAPPAAFIEVTSANAGLPLSEHFQLGQFVTHDQQAVWPKFAVLRLALVDKLECIVEELHAEGLSRATLHVMSGYRTPEYNGPGGSEGRARFSRHMYGDASDVWVESGAGVMDDLNGDGRHDVEDAKVLEQVVERVERAHPELVGGEGVYRATSAHGPFVPVDGRGRPARWARAMPAARGRGAPSGRGSRACACASPGPPSLRRARTSAR